MRPPRPADLAAATAAIALALLAGGCGSSGSTTGDSAIQPAPSGSQATPPPTASTPTVTASTPTAPANPRLKDKPTIARPTGPAPTKLVVRDLVKGTGPAAAAGKMLSVQYVGVLFKTGKQFDSSWDTGHPLPAFRLGTGAVIPGWDMGLIGMRVGGRRQLIIPSSLAYGSQGQGSIPPNAPLVFDVDLLSVQ